MLVCAPSNIAVDQLTEKIHKTGLKVTLPLSSNLRIRLIVKVTPNLDALAMQFDMVIPPSSCFLDQVETHSVHF